MFELKRNSFGPITEYVLKNKESGAFVTILPGFGGLINRLGLQVGGHIQEVMAANQDYQELFDKGRAIFRNMKLSPFPNRIKDGQYTLNGEVYTCEINEKERQNALHGFVFNKKFEVVDHLMEKEQGCFSIEYDYDGHLGGYPFPFTLRIEYTLHESKGFFCKTVFTNNSGSDVPVGDGWHPYFSTGTPVDDLDLKLPNGQWLEVDDRMIPTGNTQPAQKFTKPEKINGAHFDDCLELNGKPGYEVTQLLDTQKNVEVHIWQESGERKYNYLQVFIPPDRDAIALEPMTCAVDAFNNGKGLFKLEPNEAFEVIFGVRAGAL